MIEERSTELLKEKIADSSNPLCGPSTSIAAADAAATAETATTTDTATTAETNTTAHDDGLAHSSRKRLAFLDALLAAASVDPAVTFDEIHEEVDTFMFAVGLNTNLASQVFKLFSQIFKLLA